MTDTIEEIERQQRAERQKIISDADALRSLVAHPGWKVYTSLIETVAQNFYATAMAPLDNVMLVTVAEYAKGTLNGLSRAADLPSAKIRESDELTRTTDEE